MKSEAYLRERLRDTITYALPRLDREGVWPYPCDYQMTQAQHWFYCLAEVLDLETTREPREPLRHWMVRLEERLR